jgi:hypothetical protein
MVALASAGGLSFIAEDAFAAADITYSVKTKNTTAVTLNFSEPIEGKFVAAATDAFTMQLISGNYTTAIDRVFTGFEWDVPTGNNGTTNLLHLIVCDDCSFAVDSIPIVTYVENGRDSIHASGNAVADTPVVGAVVGHDGIAPTVESIKTLSSNKLQLTMSEDVQVNGTATSFFTISGIANPPKVTSVSNGTLSTADGADGVKGLLTLTLDKNIRFGETPTLTYATPSLGMNGLAIGDLNYPVFGVTGPCTAAFGPACSEINSGIYSTQLANFTNTAITMNLINFNMEGGFEYDLVAPTLAEATFFLNGDDVTDGNNAINISAEVGDEISVLLKVADNKPVEDLTIVGLYTNFQSIPDNMNLFYATTHDTLGKFSTTFYEWNVRSDDTDFDVNNAVIWEQGNVTIERPSVTNDNKIYLNDAEIVEYLTIPLTMTVTEAMQSSEVIVKASDGTGNYLYQKLPVTIEVSNGDPLAFGAAGDQKLLGFFDETVLFTMITKWTTTESNVDELTTILGLPEQSLPLWTTNLATWTAEQKISSADMIVAVEYLINE